MVTVENPGNELDEVTVTLNGKITKLTENSDSELLYLTVKELSRVLLNIEKQKDFHTLIQEIFDTIPALSTRRAAIGLTQIDMIREKLKERIKDKNVR